MKPAMLFDRLCDAGGVLLSLALVGLGLYLLGVAVQRNLWQLPGREPLRTDLSLLDREAAKYRPVVLAGRLDCDADELDLVEKSSYLGTPLAAKTVAHLYPFGDASSAQQIYVRFDLPLADPVACGADIELRGVWRDFSPGFVRQVRSAQQGADLKRYGPGAAAMILLKRYPDSSGFLSPIGTGPGAGLADFALYGLGGLAVIGIGAVRLYARRAKNRDVQDRPC